MSIYPILAPELGFDLGDSTNWDGVPVDADDQSLAGKWDCDGICFKTNLATRHGSRSP